MSAVMLSVNITATRVSNIRLNLVIICSFTSMLIELGLEAVFTPVGYRISSAWEKEHVGENYIIFRNRAAGQI